MEGGGDILRLEVISRGDGFAFGFRHDAGDVGKLKRQEKMDDVGPFDGLINHLVVEFGKTKAFLLDEPLEDREMEWLKIEIVFWVL